MWKSLAGVEKNLESPLARQRFELFKQAILNTRLNAGGSESRLEPRLDLQESKRLEERQRTAYEKKYELPQTERYKSNSVNVSSSANWQPHSNARNGYSRHDLEEGELVERPYSVQNDYENSTLPAINLERNLDSPIGRNEIEGRASKGDESSIFRQNEIGYRANEDYRDNYKGEPFYDHFDIRGRSCSPDTLHQRDYHDSIEPRYDHLNVRDRSRSPDTVRRSDHDNYDNVEPRYDHFNVHDRSGSPDNFRRRDHDRSNYDKVEPRYNHFNVRDRSRSPDKFHRRDYHDKIESRYDHLNVRDRSRSPDKFHQREFHDKFESRYDYLNVRDRSRSPDTFRGRSAEQFHTHRDIRPHSSDNEGYTSRYKQADDEFLRSERWVSTSRFRIKHDDIEFTRRESYEGIETYRRNALDSKVSGMDVNNDDEDDDLPRHLTRLFEDYSCGLCDAKMNTTDQADMHYNGKVHKKKVNNYMREWYLKRNLPCPAKYLPQSAKIIATEILCKVCKVKFNTSEQLVLHYKGERHRRAKENLKRQYEQGGPIEKLEGPKKQTKFFCDTCNVETSSEDQLKAHLTGQKHKKMEMRLLDLRTYIDSAKVAQNLPKPKDEKVSNKTEVVDLTDTDTPEQEKFECTICSLKNLTKSGLAKHLQSNEHRREEGLKKSQMMMEQELNSSQQFICDLCNVIVKAELKEAHIKTKAHIKALKVVDSEKAKELEESLKLQVVKDRYICDLCNIKLTDSNAFSQHMDSKKHKKRVAETKLNQLFPIEIK